MDKLLAIFFSLLILLQAYVVKRQVHTWLFPACLFGLFWFFMSFLPLVVLWSVPIDPWGTGFILLCLFFFSGSAAFFPWEKAFRRNRELSARPNLGSRFLRRSFYFLSVFTLLCVFMNSRAQGITLRDIVFHLIATAAAYRQTFSSTQFTITFWLRLGELLAYTVASLGGLIISDLPTRWKRFCVILFAFLPPAFMAIAQSSKWTLFSCIAFFFAGVMVYRVSEGNLRLINKGSLKKLVVYATILLVITIASFMSRGLQNSDNQDAVKDTMRVYLASYAFGYLYGFSDWCASQLGRHHEITYHQEPTSYGFYTFPTIARTLGSTKVVPEGTYDDYYNFENLIRGNIFTMFRGLLQDFGVVGSAIFMFLLGIAFHSIFYLLLSGRFISLTAPMFIFSVGFIYSSYGVSLFNWSGLYFTFAILFALLWWNSSRHYLHRLLRITLFGNRVRTRIAGAVS